MRPSIAVLHDVRERADSRLANGKEPRGDTRGLRALQRASLGGGKASHFTRTVDVYPVIPRGTPPPGIP